MDAATYKIILQGIQSDSNPETVTRQLARAFRSTPSKIEALLSKPPVTIKALADYTTAMKYREIIRRAGGVCRMEPLTSAAAKTPTSQAPAQGRHLCPNCGYRATSADDLLLTAHGGQGECPACGIIVARFSAEKRPPKEPIPAQPEPAEESASLFESIKSAIFSSPVTSLLVLAAVAALIYPFVRETPAPPTEANSVSAVAAVTATQTESNPDRDRSITILPGETGDLLLTTYLKPFHRDTFFPLTILPDCKITDNKWKNEGVHARIRHASVSPVSVSLWEHENSRDRSWQPVAASGMDIGLLGSPGTRLLSCNRPTALAALVEDPAMDRRASESGYRRSGYTFYRLEIELSVSVPDGPEFQARDLEATLENGQTVRQAWRSHYLLITMPFFNFDMDSSAKALMGSQIGGGSGGWQATKGGFMLSHGVRLPLVHHNGREGLVAALTPDSGWELTAY